MKTHGAKQVHYDSGPNMSPLVDIVMVILIFLMLAGSFGGSTQYLISKQGIHDKGKASVDPNQPQDIEIKIDPSSAGGREGFVAGCQSPPINANTAEDLKKALMDHQARSLNPDKLQIVLQPKTSLKYQYVIQAYQAALQANYKSVAFASSH